MSDLFEKAIVQKRNLLNGIKATNLTLQELRFFSIYLSKINPRDISTKDVRFKLSDFQQIMDFGKLNIAQLKASVDSILGKKIYVPYESGFKGIVIFDQCIVNKDSNDEWYVEISASEKAVPLMFNFKNKYFKYELWNALRLNSASQIRMYEILKQYEAIGRREISIDDLQQLLGTNYARWDRFKDKVLDNCQKALKKTTDISFDYKRGKTGKGGKWLTVIFEIKKNVPDDPEMIQLTQDIELHIHPQTVETIPEFFEPDLQTIIDFSEQNNIDIKQSDLKEIYYTMQEKGYSDILAAFKRIYQRAVNNDPDDLKKYIIGIIKNDKPLNSNNDKSAPDPDVEKYKVLINKF